MGTATNINDYSFFRRNPQRLYRVRRATESERAQAVAQSFIDKDKPAVAYVRRGYADAVVTRGSLEWEELGGEQQSREQFHKNMEIQSEWLEQGPKQSTGDKMLFHLNPDRSYRAREATAQEIREAEKIGPISTTFQVITFVHFDRDACKVAVITLGCLKYRKYLDSYGDDECQEIFEQYAQPLEMSVGYGESG